MTLGNHLSLQKCEDGFSLLSDLCFYGYLLATEKFWLIFEPVLHVMCTFILNFQ